MGAASCSVAVYEIFADIESVYFEDIALTYIETLPAGKSYADRSQDVDIVLKIRSPFAKRLAPLYTS